MRAVGQAVGAAAGRGGCPIRLPDFTQQAVHTLLGQCAEETGQVFSPDAANLLWELTQGQPWLVNALAAIAVSTQPSGVERDKPIGAAAIVQAKEQLLEQQPAHFRQLLEELSKPNVRQMVEAVLNGAALPLNLSYNDIAYVRGLGLVPPDGPLTFANPIYAELIRRDVAGLVQQT